MTINSHLRASLAGAQELLEAAATELSIASCLTPNAAAHADLRVLAEAIEHELLALEAVRLRHGWR